MLNKDNKTIYKNTIIIYVRMFVVTLIGLFSSRFVLQALGASDYGLYNVVGGLIAMLNFISTAMATTTRRFVNVEMGKPDGNVNMVFNISLLLHIGFALFILVIAETVGIWYIYNVLNVADGKLGDAMFVFQFSTIVACIGIINIPYQSLIEANEQFGKAAIIDISTTVVKFAFVVILLFYTGNALRFYAICMCVVTLFSFVLYHGVCLKQWPESIRYKYYKKSPLYKEILVFNNYTALGAAVSISKSQGCNLLINFFFGTIVNAAFAIAYQVESYVYMFVNKLTLAVNPQVAKNFSGGTMERVNMLIEKNSKYSILIMTIFFFSVVPELDFILAMWLKVVPEGTSFLCLLTLVDALVKSFSEGTNGYVQASGRIKWFQLIYSIILLSNLPLGYVLFLYGLPAYSIILCFIMTSILYRIIGLILMKKLLDFDVIKYVSNAYIRPLAIILLLAIVVGIYKQVEITSFFYHILFVVLFFIISLVTVFTIGLTRNEKEMIVNIVLKK